MSKLIIPIMFLSILTTPLFATTKDVDFTQKSESVVYNNQQKQVIKFVDKALQYVKEHG